MDMMDSDVIAEDNKFPDWSNVALDESPIGGNITYECTFNHMGLVVDHAKYEIACDVSRNRHHVCDQTAENKGRKNRVKKLWQILLESQSTCDVTMDKTFPSNVRYCKWTLLLQTQAGECRINQIGDLEGVGEVRYYPKGISNILSQCRMSDFSKCRMSCNTCTCNETGRSQDLCYEVTTKEGRRCMFLPAPEGLNSHVIPRHAKGFF